MAGNDWQSRFESALSAELRAAARPEDRPDPMEEINRLRRETADQIGRFQARSKRLDREYDQSLIGKIGLTPGTDPATIFNLAAGGTAAVDTGVRHALSMYDANQVGQATAGMTDEAYQAYARLRADERAQEELQQLEERQRVGDPRSRVAEQLRGVPGDSTEILDPADLINARKLGQLGTINESDLARMEELRSRQPEATEEDLAYLNQIVPHENDYVLMGNDAVKRNEQTYLDQLRQMEVSKERYKKIQEWGWDADSWFYSENKQNLEQDAYFAGEAIEERFREAWEKTTDEDLKEGVLDMVSVLSGAFTQFGQDAIDNPMGVIEFVIREVGEDLALAGIPGGIVVPALSRASDAYNEGIENFIEKEGRFPNEEERERMGLHSAMYFGAEYASSLILWKGMQFRRGDAGALDVAAAPARVAGHGVVEGASETVQTYAEGEARYEPTSFAERFAGGVLGTTAGTAATSVAGFDDIYEGTKNSIQKVIAARAAKGERVGPGETALKAAVMKAVREGDLDGLINPESATFAPGRAVEAINQMVASTELTDARRAELVEQANALVAALETEVGRLEETSLGQEVISQDALAENLQAWKDKLDSLPADEDPERRKILEEGVKLRQEAFDEIEAAPAKVKTQIAEARKQLEYNRKELERAGGILGELQQNELAPSNEDVSALMAQANLPATASESRAASDQVIRLAIASPESFDIDQVTALVENTENALSDTQRSFLRSFTEQQVAAHALKGLSGVTSDVFKGDREGQYVGIEQYQQRFNLHAQTGNQSRAYAQVAGLESFAQQRRTKLAAIDTGLSLIAESGGQTKRVDFDWDTERGEFVQRDKFFKTQAERAKVGGLTVTQAGTQRLRDTIQLESDALETAAKTMRQAYALQFDGDSDTAVSAAAPTAPVKEAQQESATPAVEETSAPVRQELAGGVEYVSRYSPADAQAAPDKVFVFGDNMQERGKAGQAIIRDEPNAIGIPTKWAPARNEQAYFGQDAEAEKAAITAAVDRIIEAKEAGKTVVMPQDGVGTGLAQLEQRAPEVWAHLQSELARAGLVPQETTNEASQTDSAPSTDPAPTAEADQAVPTADVTAVQQQANTTTRQESPAAVEEDGTTYDPETGEIISEAPSTQEATEEGEPVVAGEGGISQVKDAGERRQGHIGEKLAFNGANLLTEYVRQATRGEGAGLRPLTAVRDFLSRLRENLGLAQQFVGDALTEKQQELLRHLANRLPIFNDLVRDSLPAWTESSKFFRHQDFIGYFRNEETGEVDENVLTAISFAMYAWLAENASLKYHDNKGINSLLGRESKTPVTPEEAARFGDIGHRFNHMANDLGKRAAQALGLTTDSGVPQDVMEKLVGALGGRAVAALMKDGLLEMTEVSEQEMAKVMERPVRSGTTSHKFLRVPLDENSRLLADEISESNKGTQGLLTKLFGTEDVRRPPSFKPVPFKNRKPKRSLLNIPAAQEKILAKYNQTAYYFEQGMWGFWNALPEDLQVLLAGGVDMGSNLHDANVIGAEGKNNALRREIANIKDFAETVSAQAKGLLTPFYLDWEVWKMGRMGIRGSMVNPQASKIHRFLVGQAKWQHTVKLDNSDGSVDKLMLAIAEALGVKTDAQRNVRSLAEIREKLAEPVFMNGVTAITVAANNEALSDADQRALLEAVKAGGENMHTLAGLYTLAQYNMAMEAGEITMTHSLTREIDGKTNGPMFTQWLLGAAASAKDLLEMTVRGGFFTKESGFKHIGEWAEDKSKHDLYQMVAKRLNEVRALSLAQNPKRGRFYDSIDFFMGKAELEGAVTKYGRAMVKTPVTALNFGSGMGTVVNHMSKEFIQAIYDKIQKTANEPNQEVQEQTRKEIIKHLNNILWVKGMGNTINPNASLGDLQKFKVHGARLEKLSSMYANTFGKDIAETLKDVFAPLISNRNKLSKAAAMSYTLYEMAYRYERQKLLGELMASGEIYHDKQKKNFSKEKKTRLFNDLTPAQEAEVRARVAHLRPLVNSAFSAQENNGAGDLESGLFLAKQDRMTYGSFTYMNTTKMSPGYGVQNLVTHGSRRVQAGPGPGSVIWQIHSADAFTAATTFIKHNALNVHDAVITGLNDDTVTAQTFNKQTFEMLLNYAPPLEIMRSLENVATAFAQYMEENPEIKDHQGVAKILEDAVTDLKGNVSYADLTDSLLRASETAIHSQRVKLEALAELASIAQYTMEDGNYDLAPEDYARIQEKLDEAIQMAPNDAALASLQAIREAFDRTTQTTPDAVEVVEPAPEEIAETPAEVDAEADNRSDTASDLPIDQDIQIPGSEAGQDVADAIVAELQERMYDINRPLTPADLIRMAKKAANPAQLRLLAYLEGHASLKGVEVFVTEFSNIGNLGQYSATSRPQEDGTTKLANPRITLALPALERFRSGNSVMPGNTAAETLAEVLIHEMVHGVTAAALSAKSKTSAAVRLEREVAAIQQAISAWKTNNSEAFNKLGKYTQHALNEMISNPREIPTYGLTAKRAQEVLRRIPSLNGKQSVWSKFVNAMRNFLGMANHEASLLDDVLSVSDLAMRLNNQAMEQAAEDGSALPLELNMSQPNSPMEFTTQQIFDALEDSADPLAFAEKSHLQTLMDSLVNRLHGPAGAFKERARETEATGAEEVFLKSLATGKAPFVSATRVAGFSLNDQQAFVLEQMEATLKEGMEHPGNNNMARREIGQVWREARALLSPKDFHKGDWSTASPDEKADAQARWDFLFTLKNEGNANDHLARFAALGLVDPDLRAKLSFASESRQRVEAEKTLVGRIREAFMRLLDFFHNRLLGTYSGQQADKKLESLMGTLVDIEARRRARLMDDSVGFNDKAEDVAEAAGRYVRGKIIQAATSDFIRSRKNGFVQAAGSITAVVVGDRTDQLMSNLEQVRQRTFTAKQGFVAKLVTEVRGAHDGATRAAHNLLRTVSKRNEQERLKINDIYRSAVLESFTNRGADLTKEQKAAATRVLLDTDLASIMDDFTQEEMVGLLEDATQRKAAIQKAEAELATVAGPWFDYYVGAGRDLAVHMASGNVFSKHLLLNAHNIAHMLDTGYESRVDPSQAKKSVAPLDKLISLYALDYTPDSLRQELAPVMRQEMARGLESGTLMVLKLHKQMQADSLKTLFGENPTQMQKGYRAQIYNPYKSMEHAPVAARKDYEAMGYKMVGVLPKDPQDPDQEPKAMFVIADGGLNRRLTSILSYTSQKARGESRVHGRKASLQVRQDRDAYIAKLVKGGRSHDPRKESSESNMAPKLNPDGKVVGYRYLMKQSTKDLVLDRNNSVEDVFGAMAAHSFDKVSSREQNRLAMEALRAEYEEGYAKNPDAYVTLSASSQDQQLADAIKLLPADARKLMKELWGKEEMKVRGDMVDLFFGYQKYSAADAIQRSPEENSAIENLFSTVMGLVFGKKAYLRARQGGAVWSEIVTEVKDILVIKTGLTLLGNELSNVSTFIGFGVPLKNIARDRKVAMEGIIQYKRDYEELQKLQIRLASGAVRNVAEAEQRIIELQRDLEKNPIAFMLEEGMMPTIVEDVELHEDPYSYKSLLMEKTEKWSNKVWKPIRTVGRNVYMTHDTAQYKVLSQGTQVSDFVAKYTLYNHLTTRKRNRMNHADAIQRAADMYVNYDVPTSRGMQWMNDMGLLRFTKYYIRIQRPLLAMAQEHPARLALLVVLNNYLPWFDVITDSGIMNRLRNPFEMGALDYPGVLDEIATVKAANSFFK